MPDHRKVGFTTAENEQVTVDEEIAGVLVCFTQLGAKTLASCQGYPNVEIEAYVSGDRRSFKLFERNLRRACSRKKLSESAKYIVASFLRAPTQIEVGFFTQQGTYEHFALRYFTRRWNRSVCTRELTYNNEWGATETFRWESSATEAIEKALKEVIGLA